MKHLLLTIIEAVLLVGCRADLRFFFTLGLFFVVLFEADPDAPARPEIISIQLDISEVEVTVQVPEGIKKVTLEGRSRLGSGNWAPRAIKQVDGTGGIVVIRVPYLKDNEIFRVRGDAEEEQPATSSPADIKPMKPVEQSSLGAWGIPYQSRQRQKPWPDSTGTTSPESQLVFYLSNGYSCTLVTEFGIYRSIALLHIKPITNDPAPRRHIPIEGEYFYLRHGKKLKLRGSLNINTGEIKMNETYQNKPSGYFEFSSINDANNFWRKPNAIEKEPATLMYVCRSSTTDKENISRLYFSDTHQVHEWSFRDKFPAYDVLDEVWACKLPDGSLAFYIRVVRENFHMGSWSGIALPKSSNTYIHKSLYFDYKCHLTIELNENENILFKDTDCDVCCGARAYLDGKYKLESEIKVLSQ